MICMLSSGLGMSWGGCGSDRDSQSWFAVPPQSSFGTGDFSPT